MELALAVTKGPTRAGTAGVGKEQLEEVEWDRGREGRVGQGRVGELGQEGKQDWQHQHMLYPKPLPRPDLPALIRVSKLGRTGLLMNCSRLISCWMSRDAFILLICSRRD